MGVNCQGENFKKPNLEREKRGGKFWERYMGEKIMIGSQLGIEKKL